MTAAERIAAAAPPLSNEQMTRLRVLLKGGAKDAP
jgi:hypothetical protein